jgi:lipopolysaccharide/colanic/teichoic acid biosynthesis glycosyltransferase
MGGSAPAARERAPAAPVASGMSASNVEAGALSLVRVPAAEAHAVSRSTAVACRTLDIVLSLVMLLALVPVFAAIALAIRIDSPGRVLFRQRRLGRDLAPFAINKFRTMRQDAGHDRHREYVVGLISGETSEPRDGSMFKLTADDRVTRVGRFLRRSSLDELPQLWNVLRGEMSLVGPRPPIPYEVDHYPSHWFGRFAVKPGLTGLWQVSGRCEVTLEEMIRLDIEYARRRSLWVNVKILARTLPVVLHGRGAA